MEAPSPSATNPGVKWLLSVKIRADTHSLPGEKVLLGTLAGRASE